MEVIPYVNVATIPNTPKPIIKYKASEGVLKDLIPVFIDVETFMDKSAGISLSAQTLRQYIKSSYLTSIGIAIGDDDPEVVLTPEGVFAPEDSYIVDALRALALSKEHIFVCHNAAFDIRVLRFMLGIEQPQYVWCTMEGAMAAWPEFPGGYGLFNLGEGLNFPANERKLEIDLDAGNYTAAALKIYNGRDVICARTLYYRQIARFAWQEQRIAILTHNVRKFHFLVDSERLDALVLTLDANARTAEMAAKNVVMDKDDNDARLCIENGGMVSDDGIGADGLIVLDDAEICEVFNREDVDNPGMLKSVRGARLIKIIREKFGITLPTTSLKKLSPVWQAQHPKITELLRQTTRANKMISHGRRSKNLQNVPEVDVELGYFRAHTGRFSSPSQGKGLNLHNCPKHDVSIAKPVRQVFRLPPDKCFVRGDLANVEYRVEGWLTGCPSVMKMFDETLGGDRFSDPYIKGWETMTRQVITKKNPIRQVSKSATLGLGFCLDGETPIVTFQGIKQLKDVTSGDLLWNGKKWVKASGAIKIGRKPCIRLGNTWLTADHRVWWNGWRNAEDAAGTSLSSASVEQRHQPGSINSIVDGVSNVESAPILDVGSEVGRRESLPISYLTPDCVGDGSHVSTTSERAARNQKANTLPTMEAEELSVRSPPKNGYYTSKHYPDGTTGLSYWIGQTTTGTTKEEIFDSSRLLYRSPTGEVIVEDRDVYDILDVEEGHRFQAGNWLVHNCMSAFGYARVLLGVCSDPHSKVTEGSLKVMIKDLGWPLPSEQSMKMIIEKTGCSAAIAIASWNIHRLFNAAHLEFGMVADWLVNCVTQVAEVGRGRGIQGPDNMDRFIQAEKILRNMETASAAPDPAKLRLTIDDDYTANIPSVRVQCGPWPATVCWRKPAVRTNKMTNQGKPQLTILKANGLDKPFTRQLAIENVTQAAARNALCAGLLQLEDKYGTRDILHVHDEVLIITDRKREAVLAAKQQLIDVFGPKAGHPLDWAILIKPEEISVTQSLWEEETDIMHFFDEQKQEWKGGDRWGKIERGDSDMFDNLP